MLNGWARQAARPRSREAAGERLAKHGLPVPRPNTDRTPPFRIRDFGMKRDPQLGSRGYREESGIAGPEFRMRGGVAFWREVR
jgi:hypothetical protein